MRTGLVDYFLLGGQARRSCRSTTRSEGESLLLLRNGPETVCYHAGPRNWPLLLTTSRESTCSRSAQGTKERIVLSKTELRS